MQAPVAPAAAPACTDDPCKRIKLEIPKFDGKNAESWIISFERYCKILKLKTDEDIVLAMGDSYDRQSCTTLNRKLPHGRKLEKQLLMYTEIQEKRRIVQTS